MLLKMLYLKYICISLYSDYLLYRQKVNGLYTNSDVVRHNHAKYAVPTKNFFTPLTTKICNRNKETKCQTQIFYSTCV